MNKNNQGNLQLPYECVERHEPGRAPMLTVVTEGSNYTYPLATLHRIRCNEAEGELVLSFIADVVKIRGRGLDALQQQLVESKVTKISSQGEAAEALSTAAVTVSSIKITQHRQRD